jgi:4'-phosphopantetheinyl transferase
VKLLPAHCAGDGPTVWLLDLEDLDGRDHFERWHEAGLINEDELTASRRYRHLRARSQFLAGRALVRHAMSVQARFGARDVAIVPDRMGKPRLATQCEASPWHFNLSHSGRLVACAFAQSEVGVDVETTSRDVDYRSIARAHFSLQEADWIDSSSARSKKRFTLLWTLKEAYLKAVGVGISVPLDGIVFSAIKHGSCRVQSRDLAIAESWYCRFLSVRQDYWLSVCSDRGMPRVDLRWLDADFARC